MDTLFICLHVSNNITIWEKVDKNDWVVKARIWQMPIKLCHGHSKERERPVF